MRFRNSFPAKEYLDGAQRDVYTRFRALATHFSDQGKLPDGTHGHFLKGKYSKIFEFKPKSGRVFGFIHKNTCYLTNGAPKRPVKAQEADYEIALQMRADFFERLEKAKKTK